MRATSQYCIYRWCENHAHVSISSIEQKHVIMKSFEFLGILPLSMAFLSYYNEAKEAPAIITLAMMA
jgi:hypothetical protein